MASSSGEHGFIFGVLAFLGFMIFMTGLGAPEVLIASDYRSDVELPSESEACTDGKPISCFFDNVEFFFKVAVFDTSIVWFSLIVITPMLVTFIYILLKLLPFVG